MKEGKDKFCGMTQTFVSVAAGGWIVVVVILLICMIGLVVGSVFGIFAPNPDNENGITIVQTVREANAA